MTVNDRPELRGLFALARVEGVTLSYSAGGNDRSTEARELLVRSP